MNDFHPDRRPYQTPPRKILSFVLTVAVHIGLLSFLFFGVNWRSKPLVSLEVGLVGAPSASTPAPAHPPEPPKPEPPKPEPPKPEPPPQPEPEIATKNPEPPKTEKKPGPEKKHEPEKKPERKLPEPSLKPIDIQKQLEQKLDQDIKRTAEAKKANEILGGRQQGQGSQRVGNPGELDAYRSVISAKIRRNLPLLPGLSGNPSAVFEIEQVMGSGGGEVINVKLKQSSGNQALDEAIARAIRKSSPLPPPDDPVLFNRRLEITVWPLEE
ncbi:MAG: TonB family protein [Azoarcus sp.]|jgi:colicin import membrane protein|nr:TonB family protein [Azoarcus sp.]